MIMPANAKYKVIQETVALHGNLLNVSVLCEIADVSRSGYQIITPSAWSLSTRGNNNSRGTAEQALVGTVIQSIDNPVELGRIIRSFDPCVS